MRYIKSVLQKMLPEAAIVRLRALDYRRYSAQEYRLLAKLCDRNKCSVDVGANVGVLTECMARFSSHVYAYEPNPELAARLRLAFRDKVTVIQAALSDVEGSTVLKIPCFDGVEQHGLASIAQDFKDAQGIREFVVPMHRLDDQPLSNVGFVKIDVEQNEEKVLRGAMRLIATQRPNLLVEVSPKRYSQTIQEFLSDILRLGYHAYFIFDGSLVQLADYDMAIHNNASNYGVRGKYMTNVVLSTQALI